MAVRVSRLRSGDSSSSLVATMSNRKGQRLVTRDSQLVHA